MSKPTLGKETGSNRDVVIDVSRLVETRMLVAATSGAGKSWALRRILEQTHGHVQQIVIDPEDEFHTLREKYDYVLAGRHGGDCPADVRSAQLLATKLLELGVSAIIGIYELPHHDRIRFVRLFLESLVNARRDLWHPCLVVIDESHMFAPESGKGEAESRQAVADLMSRGRKRGFCGIPATQRYSKLDKDVASMCSNVLIGKFTLDVDVKRAVEALGFTGNEDKARVRALSPGEFFCQGPALSQNVTLVKVGDVATTHPKAGQRAAAPAPPQTTIKKVLGELADLPAEAEKKAKTENELRSELEQVRRDLRQARAQQPLPIDPEALQKAEKRGYERAVAESRRAWTPLRKAVEHAVEDLQKNIPAELEWNDSVVDAAPRLNRLSGPEAKPVFRKLLRPAVGRREQDTSAASNGDLTGPEHRILDAIAWLESLGIETPEQVAVAFLAGYTYGGGAFNNPRGALRTKGLIDYAGDCVRLTDQGRALANYPGEALDSAELQRRVLDRLPGPEQKILSVLLEAYPNAVENDECARAAGYTPDGGAYNNPRGRLRTLGLVDYPSRGMVRARDLLFLS